MCLLNKNQNYNLPAFIKHSDIGLFFTSAPALPLLKEKCAKKIG